MYQMGVSFYEDPRGKYLSIFTPFMHKCEPLAYRVARNPVWAKRSLCRSPQGPTSQYCYIWCCNATMAGGQRLTISLVVRLSHKGQIFSATLQKIKVYEVVSLNCQ